MRVKEIQISNFLVDDILLNESVKESCSSSHKMLKFINKNSNEI